MSWIPRLLLAAAAFGLGAVCAVWLGAEPKPGVSIPAVAAEPASGLAEEVARLRSRLDAEGSRRAALEQEVARLSAEVDRLFPPEAVAAAGREAPQPQVREPSPRGRPEEAQRFDAARLEAAGFDADVVRDVEQRIADVELGRLYLRNQAEREGWLRSARFRTESAELAAQLESLREEYGDDLYDWMLFSRGQPNRIVVSDVIPGSAAQEAGLLPGDRVVHYDDERVFSGSELRQATLEGQAGASVSVEIERDGETLRLLLPRGPLGIRMAPGSEEPPQPR